VGPLVVLKLASLQSHQGSPQPKSAAPITPLTPSTETPQNAVRMLADTFEVLRPKLKGVITTKDEGDLFNIANNFAIRHSNEKQRTQYDRSLWLSWMFYFYLATLHFALRRLQKPVSP
jgi:hypothetical protein